MKASADGWKVDIKAKSLAFDLKELQMVKMVPAWTLLLVGCANAPVPEHPEKEFTEEAFVAAIAVGNNPAPCNEVIGKEPALALVRFCRDVSSATHPPCNTANHCAIIVEHVEGMCHAFPATDDHPLPCIDGLPSPEWDRIGKISAM